MARINLADAIDAHLAVAWADYEAAQAARAAARPQRRRRARRAAVAVVGLALIGFATWVYIPRQSADDRGVVGSTENARHWYQRADELGHPEAKARMDALR